MAIRFNGFDLPPFVLVNDIHVSLLPPVSQRSQSVAGRAGAYDFGNVLGEREITVDITVEANTASELRSRLRQLATWLYYEEAKPLILLDEPDKYYLAKVTDAIDLKQNISIVQGSITFWCSDPFSYAVQETVIPLNPTDDTPISIINHGNVDTYPQIAVTFVDSITEFGIATTDQYLYFGQPTPVDTSTPTPTRTKVLEDDMSTTTGWTNGIAVDDGVIAGSFTASGSVLVASNYGTGSRWHGPALVKSIGQTIQDFSVSFFCTFRTPIQANQLGRIEIYLLDINNAIIGKMAIVDPTAYATMGRVDCRLGNATNGKYIVSSEIGKYYYRDFYGRLHLSRIGNKYNFGIGKIDAKGNYWGRWSTTYVDTAGRYQTPLAGVQIHMAQFGTYPLVSNMTINHIDIYDETPPIAGEVPYVFEAGDTLWIDSATGSILKNGEPAFWTLGDLGSNFLKLQPGETKLSVTAPIITNGTITFRERWL
jgi:predicted phage tail component-like protein